MLDFSSLSLLIIFANVPNCFSRDLEPKMLSTKSPISPQLTTHAPAHAKAAKAELADILYLTTILGSTQEMKRTLTTSAQLVQAEKELQELLEILLELENSYNAQPKDPYLKRCSLKYGKLKEVALTELDVMIKVCGFAVNNANVNPDPGKLSTEEEQLIKTFILLCVKDSKRIPLEVVQLVEMHYQHSFMCAMDGLKSALGQLYDRHYFGHVEASTALLAKEVEYLIRECDKGMLTSKELPLLKEEFKNITSPESMKIRGNAIGLFHEKIKPSKLNLHAEKLVNYIKTIYTKYLKYGQASDALQQVVIANERVKEMISEVLNILPKTHPNHRTFVEANKLYSNKSTIGEPCENTPAHPAGTCAQKNHEVCVDTFNDAIRSVLKPFKEDLDSEEEEKENPKIRLTKSCRCGYRTDCTSSGEYGRRKTTCFLVTDHKGHCLGNVGYPCKTHPLARGQYDGSCISGYCNVEDNRCEWADTVDKMMKVSKESKGSKSKGMAQVKKLEGDKNKTKDSLMKKK